MIGVCGIIFGTAVLAAAGRELSVDTEGRSWRHRAPLVMSSQLVVPASECQDLIRRFHDSLFADHLGVSRTTYHLLDRVYWPGLL